MPETFYTVKITNDAIRRQIAKTPSRRLDFVVDIGEDGEQDIVGFVYAKGELVADDVLEKHLYHFRGTPDFHVDGESAIERFAPSWTHEQKNHADRQERTLGVASLPSDHGELKDILAATLKLLGQNANNAAPVAATPSITREAIKSATLDDEGNYRLSELLALETNETMPYTAPTEVIKLYAAAAKLAKINSSANESILEIVEDAKVRAELLQYAEPEPEIEPALEEVVVIEPYPATAAVEPEPVVAAPAKPKVSFKSKGK